LPPGTERPTPNALCALDRLINLASGEICEIVHEGTHIFYRAPDLRTVIYLINRAIGTPGAQIVTREVPAIMGSNIEKSYKNVLRGLENLGRKEDPLAPEGPFSAAISEQSIRDTSCLQQAADIEKKVIEFLPTAIARLKEICAGVIIRKDLKEGTDRTYNLAPNRRAIRYVATRIDGGSFAVVSEILERERQAAIEPPKRTADEIKAMSRLEHSYYFNARSKFEFQRAAKQKAKLRNGAESPVAHVAAAHKLMSEFLPTALKYMNILAVGAVTRLDYGGVTRKIEHKPDPYANQFLLDRFAGAPAAALPAKLDVSITNLPNKADIEACTSKIMKLCKKHAVLTNEKVTAMLNQIAGKHQLRLSLYAQ
jgi:hypothetical protein